MSPRTKSWVKGLRRLQLALRVLHFIAAAGLLVLWILFDKIDDVTAWVMRITVRLYRLQRSPPTGQH